MGLGKTIEMIALILTRRMRTLVIVPDLLKEQWKGEVSEHVTKAALAVVVLDDDEMASSFYPTTPRLKAAGVVLVSYGSLSKKTETRRLEKLLSDADISNFPRFVVDESAHAIGERSENTIAFKFLYKYATPKTSRWLLSGTPASDSVGTMRVQLGLLNLHPFCRLDFWDKVCIFKHPSKSRRALFTFLYYARSSSASRRRTTVTMTRKIRSRRVARACVLTCMYISCSCR